MSILRGCFFLFVFLFHSFAFSQAVTEDTAEVIFTDFATDLLLEGHIAMQAVNLIVLQNPVGPMILLKLLKTGQQTKLESF